MSEEKKSIGGVIGSVVGQIVLGCVCLVGGWLVRDMTPEKPKELPPKVKAMAAAAAMPQIIATTNVELRVYNMPERFIAHAEPVQEVDLLPQVDGYVKEILFKEGELVKAGQILYVLDDERYQAVVNQRKANLSAAEAEERRTKRMYERMVSADARGVTELERDNAEAAWETAKASVLLAKANLIVAEYDLKKAKVVAPISGQIGKTSAHIGDYVAPSKGPLARIVQVDPIRVTFPITDRSYISWRQNKKEVGTEGFRMRLLLPNDTEYDQEGEFDFDDNQMSKETATITMRLKFPNPDRVLIPNSYVTMLSDSQNPPKYPSVPQQAIFDLPGGDLGVYVVKPDGTAEARVVTVKDSYEGWTPITNGGISEGENVVIAGVHKVKPGAKVMPLPATPNEDIR